MNSFPFSSRPELRLFLAGSVLFHILLILLLWKLPGAFILPSSRQNKDLELTLLNDNADNKQTPLSQKRFASLEQSRAHGQVTKEKGMNMVQPQPGASGEVKAEGMQQTKPEVGESGDIMLPEKNSPRQKQRPETAKAE